MWVQRYVLLFSQVNSKLNQKKNVLPNEIMDQNLHCINSAPLQFPNLGHTMLPNSVEADMYYYIIPSNLPAHYSTHYSPAYKP